MTVPAFALIAPAYDGRYRSCSSRMGTSACTRSWPLIDPEYPAKCFTVAVTFRPPAPPLCMPRTSAAPMAAASVGSSDQVS